MQSFIEPFYKSPKDIQFGWSPEPGATAYAVYVGLAKGSLTKLADHVSAAKATEKNVGKVPYTALLSDVQSVLSTTWNFTDNVFWFAITFYDVNGSESNIANSRVVAVPPTGIVSIPMRDDPQRMSQVMAFSPELQRWIKVAASSSGAMASDNSLFFQANMVTAYTYDGTNVSTIKQYPSDATASGMPAKLITNTWSGSQLTMTVVSDSTV